MNTSYWWLRRFAAWRKRRRSHHPQAGRSAEDCRRRDRASPRPSRAARRRAYRGAGWPRRTQCSARICRRRAMLQWIDRLVAPLSPSRVSMCWNDRGLVAVRDVNLSIRAGEIVGLAAIEGAGAEKSCYERSQGERSSHKKASCGCRSPSASCPKIAIATRWYLAYAGGKASLSKGAGNRRGRLTLGGDS